MLGIYARQSRFDEKTTKQSSVLQQIQQGKEVGKQLNLDIKIYEDIDQSAAYDTLGNRPGFQRLVEDIKAGIVKAVYAEDQNRVSRNQTTYLFIKKLFSEHKVVLHTTLDGIINFDDGDSEFMSDIRIIFGNKFIKDTSKKIKAKLLSNATNGRVGGGLYKSFGYKKSTDGLSKLIIDEEEAPIIKKIYALYLEGNGSDKIAQYLNEKGIKTKSSKVLKEGLHLKDKYTKQSKIIPKDSIQWVGPTVLAIIKNTIYKGERMFKQKIYPAPPIIDVATWDKAQAIVQRNRNVGGKITHQYLLNGLLFCSREGCGCGFKGRTRESKRDHVYYCTSKNNAKGSCGIRSINIDYLNNIIWELVTDSDTISRLATEEVEKLKNPKHIKELEAEKKRLKGAINSEEGARGRVLELVKRDAVSLDKAEADLKDIQAKIRKYSVLLDAVLSQLNNQNNTIKLIDEVKAAQEQLTLIKDTKDYETQHKLIRLFIDAIWISFDDELQVFTLSLSIKIGGGDDNNKLVIDSQKGKTIKDVTKSFMKKGKAKVETEVTKIKWVKDQISTAIDAVISSPLVQYLNGCSACRGRRSAPTWRNIPCPQRCFVSR